MHILFLTDNFPPEGNAPATRTFEHAREWVSLGHKVTVVTTAPNFPEGKVFPGYKNNWYSKEQLAGIEVVRVKTYITANSGFAKRILDYMSFMVTGLVAGLFIKKPDVIVATSPQFFNALGGWVLSKLRRKPFVFELRDIWPASITAVGAMEKSIVIRALEKLELFLYRQADCIISLTESFKTELIGRGINKDKISVVLNGVDLSQYSPREKDKLLESKYKLEHKLVIGYIGTHGMAHALGNILDAAELLSSNANICFLFAGGGAELDSLRDNVAKRNLSNVIILGRQDKQIMPSIWSLCDVSLVHLKDVDLFRSVIPSKIFESMGMGIPILIAVPEGEATRLVATCEAGLVVKPEAPDKLVEAIQSLYNNPDIRLKLASSSHQSSNQFDRRMLAVKMLDSLKKLEQIDRMKKAG
jgi:colanic acid biosynthesis glycosyl transferase WcaI